ncbi:MAG: ABC transporter permease, partial [Thiomicrorhabdus sp.]|nr:ABC transporter permease [Thiomicrorhabdus sp.]
MSTLAAKPTFSISQIYSGFRKLPAGVQNFSNAVLGMALLLLLWWIGGILIESNPDTEAFAGFAPGPAFSALAYLIETGSIWETIYSSLYRIVIGLFWGIVIGVPVGVLVGYFVAVRQVANMPFQFLRMISPLAWMPIAVLAFETWDNAIIFLLIMATVWPIVF